VEVARRPSTLTLAADAVRDLAGPRPWVLAVREGKAARVPVELGARGVARVEVLSPLGEGELVIPAAEGGSARPVREGEKVRVTARREG